MLGRWLIESYEEQGREERRKRACRMLRGARKRGGEEGILMQLWDNYRRVRMGVKIRKEKKELKKRMRKFGEQGGRAAHCFGLILEERERNKG